MPPTTNQPDNQPPHRDQIASKIRDRSATVAVVGLGYVGLPLVAAIHALPAQDDLDTLAGGRFPVIGFDIDPVKIDKLTRAEPYIDYIAPTLWSTLAASDRFTPTSDETRLADADIIILCVPTPLDDKHQPDLSFVLSSAEMIGRNTTPGTLVILESTTYPGTTRDEMAPAIINTARARGLTLTPGDNLFLAYSPEREDPGRKNASTATIPKVVGGIDEPSLELAAAFYSTFVEQVVEVSTAEAAEASKLLENIYRAVNIALVNELKLVFEPMGIDIWEVIRAASTKPFGFQPFYPGPGLGGHCIPIDPFYLSWKAKQAGHETRFIELAGEINRAMPARVVARAEQLLTQHNTKLSNARILILGIAYKPDVDDVRESPAAEIIQLLQSRGATVSYHDPHVPRFPAMRNYDINLESIPLTPETLAAADAVIIVTNHANTDYTLIANHARRVIDTRNAMAGITNPNATIIKA